MNTQTQNIFARAIYDLVCSGKCTPVDAGQEENGHDLFESIEDDIDYDATMPVLN